MKLLKTDGGRYTFRLGKRERSLFTMLLRQYPLIRPSHHRRSPAGGQADPANQALLEEVLTGQQDESKKRILRLLDSQERFRPDGPAFIVTFDREEMEWLLQVLNDVRVGSWINLGCPEPDAGQNPNPTPPNVRDVLCMELAGHFECVLLEAVDGSQQ